MKNLLTLLGLAVVVFAAAGWYLGWYRLSVSKNLDGTLRVQTDVDTAKAGTDLSRFGRKVEGYVENQVDKSHSAPASTPGPQSQPAAATVPTSTTAAPDAAIEQGEGWLLGHVLGTQPGTR